MLLQLINDIVPTLRTQRRPHSARRRHSPPRTRRTHSSCSTAARAMTWMMTSSSPPNLLPPVIGRQSFPVWSRRLRATQAAFICSVIVLYSNEKLATFLNFLLFILLPIPSDSTASRSSVDRRSLRQLQTTTNDIPLFLATTETLTGKLTARGQLLTSLNSSLSENVLQRCKISLILGKFRGKIEISNAFPGARRSIYATRNTDATETSVMHTMLSRGTQTSAVRIAFLSFRIESNS